MKSFLAACTLFLLLAALSLGNARYMERLSASLLEPLEKAQDCALQQHWEEGSAALLEMEQQWQKRLFYLQIIVEHDEIERAEDLLASLQAFMSQRELPECLAELAQLRHQILLLSNLQQPTLGYLL